MYRRIPVKLIAIIVIVIVLVSGTVLAIPKYDKIEYEVISDGVEGTGVIFRDEQVITLDQYEKIYFQDVYEGQLIESGQKIASAYKKGYITATFNKLKETEANIVTYQNQSVIVGFDDKTLEEIDFRIDVTIREMTENEEGFVESFGKLAFLMQEREEYIRENYNTSSDTYLQELYEDEARLIESLDAWCDELVAQKSGFIDFYCDGLEDELLPQRALELSYSEIDSTIKKEAEALNAVKIVSDGVWYVTVKVKNVSKFNAGTYYPVYISNEKESEIGFLEKIIDVGREKALVFSFSDNVEKYLDIRTATVFVGTRYEGFSVKSRFVKNNSVKVKVNKEKTTVGVEVLYSDGDVTLFKVKDDLNLGQKVFR